MTSFAILNRCGSTFRSKAAQKGALSNVFTLNLPSVPSRVPLVHLLNKIGKDIGYWWDWAFFSGRISSEHRPTGLEHQFKVKTFAKLKKLI